MTVNSAIQKAPGLTAHGGTAHSQDNKWKRASLPVTDIYPEVVGSNGSIDDLLNRKAGNRASMSSAYNSSAKHRTHFYEETFQYKDDGINGARERVQRESPVIAELRTNVIIKDEFTLVTDLSHHLAARYTRPDSSIMVNVDHSSCLALAGTFDPCYILSVSSVPSQMQPTTNKRNAALIQSFMADILSVPPDRGIVKFTTIPEENLATNGNTMLGEIERLEKQQGGDAGAKRALTHSRTSVPLFKKSTPKLNSNARVIGASSLRDTPESVRSRSNTPPPTSPIPNVFELPATDSDERPLTAHGNYAQLNGLRMNGISKEDLLSPGSRTPNGRPKTIAGQPTPPVERSQTELMPPLEARPRNKAMETATTSGSEGKVQPANIPVSPKPALIQRPPSTDGIPELKKPPEKPAPKPRDTYMDNVTTTARPVSRRVESSKTAEPTKPPKGREDDDRRSIKDIAANTAKRRSTITATPKMPPPPPVPVPVPATKTTRVSKRKSFLSAFRR